MADYPETLQNFAKSIEGLSAAILEQVKQQQDANKVQDMAKAIIDVNSINENVEATRGNTEEILALLKKQSKKDKSASLLEKLGGVGGKTKGIADGIKTIGLMAGAIMALGLSFKVVGGVDFTSVLALSAAMPLMAMAFATINESIGSYEDALLATGSMVLMSTGIMVSGLILQYTPALSIMQLVTSVGVAISMGIAMYAMAEAADNIGKNKIMNLYSITPVMPLVAAGLTLSGLILANMPTIGIQQVLSSIGVGVALGAAMIPLALAARVIGSNTGDMAEMGLIMPIIAFGIMSSSLILQQLQPVDMEMVLTSSLAVAGATVIGGAALKAIDLMKLNIGTALQGALMLPIISAGIMISSHILALGNYENYPSLEWAGGFAISMIASLPPVLVYGSLVSSGMGALVIAGGILGMIAVAGGITAVSHIFALGNYDKYPSLGWAAGVGLAMMGFVPAVVALGALITTGVGAIVIYNGISGVKSLSQALVDVSAIISQGTYTGGPSPSWALGVGTAIAAFGAALAMTGLMNFLSIIPGMGGMDEQIDNVKKLAQALPDIGEIISASNATYTGGPSKQWSEGVGTAIAAFATALGSIQPGIFDKITNMFGFGGDTANSNLEMIKQIARTLPEIAQIIREGGGADIYTGGPTKDWAEGVGMSVTAFATAIATMADEIDSDEVVEWLPSLTNMASLIPLFAMKMAGMDFKNYPGKNWSEGILEFITNITNMKSGSVNNTIKNVDLLADAHFRLANSIAHLAIVLNKVGKSNLPDLSNIYGGLITLSLIDSKNLDTVLTLFENKQAKFTELLNVVTGVGNQVNSNDGGAAINFLKNNNQSNSGSGTPVSSRPAQQTQQQQQKDDKSEVLLTQMVDLQKQVIDLQRKMNRVLDEIADNTVKEKDFKLKV